MNPVQRWLAMLAFIHASSDGGVASKRVKDSDQIRMRGNDLMLKNSSNTSGRARKRPAQNTCHQFATWISFPSINQYDIFPLETRRKGTVLWPCTPETSFQPPFGVAFFLVNDLVQYPP